MEKYKNLFTCCLCEELVNPKKAKLMPCLHTLCAPCEISADKIDNTIICAKCNQKWAVKDIADHFLVRTCYTNLIKCTSCCDNLIAEFKCSDCSDFLCSVCANAHKRVKLSKHHCLTQLNTDCPTSEPCKSHTANEVDRFCATCNEIACNECQREKHNDHSVQLLEESTSQYNKFLLTLLNKLKLLSEEIENYVKSTDKHLTEIDDFENEIKERLRLFLAEIETMCITKRKPYLDMKSCTDMYSSAANQVTTFVEATVECPNQAIVHYTKDIIQSAFCRASELFKAADSLTPNLKSNLQLPNIKQIIDRLVVDTKIADTTVSQKVPANGSAANKTPSKCITSPACLSVSPNIGCNRNQTASVEMISSYQQHLPINFAHPFAANQLIYFHQQEFRNRRISENNNVPMIPYQPTLQVIRQPIFSLQTPNAEFAPMAPNQANFAQSIRSEESGTSVQDQQNYCQEQQPRQFERNLPPNCHIIYDQQGVPFLFDHVTKTTSHLDPSRNVNQQDRNSLPAHQQQNPAMMMNWQQQRFPQNPYQQQQHVFQVQQQANFPSPAYDFRYRFPQQQTQSLLQQRLAQPAVHLSLVTRRARSQHFSNPIAGQNCAQNVHGLRSAVSPNSLAAITPARNQTLSKKKTGPKSKWDNPKKRLKRTTSGLQKIQAEDRSNLNNGSPANIEQNISTDFDDRLVVGPLSESTQSVRSSTNLTPKQKSNQNSFAETISPTGSLPILNVDNLDTILNGTDAGPTLSPNDVVAVTQEIEWEDDCCVCQNGERPMLHCSGADCFRSFHLDHHVPEYETIPTGRFVCNLCINLDNYKTNEDEMRNGNRAAKSMKSYLTAFERKICERILLQLYCHCESLPFHTIEKEFYDNYYFKKDGVRPMDLKMIKNKLNSKDYSSVEEFIADVNQIFINCSIYHDPNSENGQKGQIVGTDYFKWVQELIPRLIDFVKLTK